MKRLLTLALSLLAPALGTGSAAAETWPAHPVRIVVPFGPGGGTDTVTSPKRSPVAPDVPTIAESGYPEFAIVNWYAILAPSGTPPAVVETLNREIGIALKEPQVVERLEAAGLEPTSGTPAELEALVQRDIEKYRRIIATIATPPGAR